MTALGGPLRFSVSILGSEVLAVEFGPSEGSSEALRYDPASTTACQTETAYSEGPVVQCGFGFGSDVAG